MDSIIRACCLCSSSLPLPLFSSTQHRRSLHDEKETERGCGCYVEYNLNLYRAQPVSWQDCFSSAIKAIVTELDEFFPRASQCVRARPRLSRLLFIFFARYVSPPPAPRCNSACMFYAIYCYMAKERRQRERGRRRRRRRG